MLECHCHPAIALPRNHGAMLSCVPHELAQILGEYQAILCPLLGADVLANLGS